MSWYQIIKTPEDKTHLLGNIVSRKSKDKILLAGRYKFESLKITMTFNTAFKKKVSG